VGHDDLQTTKSKGAKSNRICDRRCFDLSSCGCFEHLRVSFSTSNPEDNFRGSRKLINLNFQEEFMYKINKRGQSTVEYVLLVAAVIAVMIAFTTNKSTGLQQHLNATLDSATGQMDTMSDKFAGAYNASSGSSPNSAISVNVTSSQ
jgi:Flp pilus assembly pilin Flp